MPKRFCVTGTCIPEKNYMVDISGRIDRIILKKVSTLRLIVHVSMERQRLFTYWNDV